MTEECAGFHTSQRTAGAPVRGEVSEPDNATFSFTLPGLSLVSSASQLTHGSSADTEPGLRQSQLPTTPRLVLSPSRCQPMQATSAPPTITPAPAAAPVAPPSAVVVLEAGSVSKLAFTGDAQNDNTATHEFQVQVSRLNFRAALLSEPLQPPQQVDGTVHAPPSVPPLALTTGQPLQGPSDPILQATAPTQRRPPSNASGQLPTHAPPLMRRGARPMASSTSHPAQRAHNPVGPLPRQLPAVPPVPSHVHPAGRRGASQQQANFRDRRLAAGPQVCVPHEGPAGPLTAIASPNTMRLAATMIQNVIHGLPPLSHRPPQPSRLCHSSHQAPVQLTTPPTHGGPCCTAQSAAAVGQPGCSQPDQMHNSTATQLQLPTHRGPRSPASPPSDQPSDHRGTSEHAPVLASLLTHRGERPTRLPTPGPHQNSDVLGLLPIPPVEPPERQTDMVTNQQHVRIGSHLLTFEETDGRLIVGDRHDHPPPALTHVRVLLQSHGSIRRLHTPTTPLTHEYTQLLLSFPLQSLHDLWVQHLALGQQETAMLPARIQRVVLCEEQGDLLHQLSLLRAADHLRVVPAGGHLELSQGDLDLSDAHLAALAQRFCFVTEDGHTLSYLSASRACTDSSRVLVSKLRRFISALHAPPQEVKVPGWHDLWPRSAYDGLLALSATAPIRTLSISGTVPGGLPVADLPPLPHVINLNLDRGLDDSVLNTLLYATPNLKHLTVPGMDLKTGSRGLPVSWGITEVTITEKPVEYRTLSRLPATKQLSARTPGMVCQILRQQERDILARMLLSVSGIDDRPVVLSPGTTLSACPQSQSMALLSLCNGDTCLAPSADVRVRLEGWSGCREVKHAWAVVDAARRGLPPPSPLAPLDLSGPHATLLGHLSMQDRVNLYLASRATHAMSYHNRSLAFTFDIHPGAQFGGQMHRVQRAAQVAASVHLKLRTSGVPEAAEGGKQVQMDHPWTVGGATSGVRACVLRLADTLGAHDCEAITKITLQGVALDTVLPSWLAHLNPRIRHLKLVDCTLQVIPVYRGPLPNATLTHLWVPAPTDTHRHTADPVAARAAASEQLSPLAVEVLPTGMTRMCVASEFVRQLEAYEALVHLTVTEPSDLVVEKLLGSEKLTSRLLYLCVDRGGRREEWWAEDRG